MNEAPQRSGAAPGSSIMNRIVASSLRQRFLVLLMTAVLIGAGIWSLRRLPVDAYPDLSPPMVEVITQWPGRAAEEVERLITVPVEREMNGIPRLSTIRSISLYGLSDVILTYENGTDNYFARQQVQNRLPDLTMPVGVSPSLSPMSAPSGLIYRYVLQSPDRSPMELKTFEDWTVEPQYKSVPGVADDSGFGGGTMQYQVLLDPARVASVGLSVAQVESALAANNDNSGGGFYSQGGEFYYVRGLGRLETLEDIGNVVLAVHDGVPVLVKDVGRVVIGIAPRLGEFGYEKQDDAVEGVILLRTGEKTQDVLKGVEAKTRELNEQILPKDVKVVPFYDRSDLVDLTTQVVERNLLRGMVLVIVVLIFFLYDLRAGIDRGGEHSARAAFRLHLPRSPKRLGESALHRRDRFRNPGGRRGGDGGEHFPSDRRAQGQPAQRQGHRSGCRGGGGPPALLFGRGDRGRVPAHLCPVGSLGDLVQTDGRHDGLRAGRLLDRDADASAGALRLVHAQRRPGKAQCGRSNSSRTPTPAGSMSASSVRGRRPWPRPLCWRSRCCSFLESAPSSCRSSTKGALWVRATMPYTISFDESAKIAPQVRDILRSFPEVTTVASELGRPDDGTDSTGFFNVEFYVDLKPYAAWNGEYRNKAGLIEAINRKLEAFPGITFNYTQPAEDAVDEAETGLKSALAVKVFGANLETLQQKGKSIKQILERVRGIRDVTFVQELGQPSLSIKINRAAIARYGLNVADINAVVQTAIGGDAATQVVQEEKQFDLIVRLEQEFRDNAEEIGNILVATPAGQQIPLREFADIHVTNGASFIYRENNSRYIGVQFSVEGRDLAGAVNDAIQQVNQKVSLPEGYRLDWGGEYSEYTASRAQLNVILPLTLFLIFLLLFALYSNFKFPFITVLGVLLSAPVGGIVALWISGTPFSASSGIGFLALFGVSVQTAIVYISYVNELRRDGTPLAESIRQGAMLRLRPIMMTALVAALGLLPVALATGVGTDTQRPFALVIVSGLFTRLLISIFLMPVLYTLVARPGDRLEV